MSLPPFTVVAPMVAADGYGASAEQLILAACDQGADIAYVSHNAWEERDHADPRLVALEAPASAVADRDLVVVNFLPFAAARFRSKVTVLQTMFETDSIPPFWTGLCDSTDGLVVPSEHCQRAFSSQVSVPVEVASYGADTGFFTPVIRRRRVPFMFLMAGLLHYRKGVEFCLRAFREEFGRGEQVRLILKTRRGFLDTGSEVVSDPRVQVVDETYTRSQMRDLYWSADCLVACSRGEAAGLTPREAMATGLPVIVTDWGGLSELADRRYCWPTGTDGLEAAPPECSSYSAGVAGHAPIGNFCVPSVSELRRAMREVYENPPGAYERGLAGARWIMETFDWRVCAGRWLSVLEWLYDRATAPGGSTTRQG